MKFVFEFLYLLAAVLFIVGLKFLSSPAHARRGNTTAALGMLVATLTLLASLLVHPEGGPPHNLGLIVAAIAIGAVAGAVGARRVAMTDMPQMVAILNGCGGGSAALISTAEFLHLNTARAGADAMFGCIIGSISLSGSVVAFAKLQGLVSEKAINSPLDTMVKGIDQVPFEEALNLKTPSHPDEYGWYDIPAPGKTDPITQKPYKSQTALFAETMLKKA